MKETEKYTTNLMGGRVSVQSLIRDLKSPNSFVRWEAACRNDPISSSSSIKIDASEYKWFQNLKTITNNRILLSVNPMATDKTINEEIKKLKSNKRRLLKKELAALKKNGNRIYYPRDIADYIGWLSMYAL